MALWEYKVITSGPHGFASPSLLETHLNALGKDEWEIIHFQTLPNNPLAFHGLARRSTTRDWTPPPEVVATATAAPKPVPAAYEPPAEPMKPVSRLDVEKEPAAPVADGKNEAAPTRDASLRTFRDTERDLDPDAEDEEDDWDQIEEDELPTFFEAIKPHLRRNQKGPGMSVGIDHLARRWEQKESDIVGALKECGLTIPETEEADPEYFEFEGDLYWVNRNNRGQLFLNTREKPRPVFRIAQANKLSPDDPAAAELVAERAAEKAEIEKRNADRAERQAAAEAAREAARLAREQREAEKAANGAAQPAAESATSAEPLPAGPELLDKIRPLMRRNRRGPGYSGSVGFLARALKQSEADLVAAFASVGLNAPANPNEKPVNVEIGNAVYWINKDGRGGIWINGREKRESDNKQGAASTTADTSAESAASEPAPAAAAEPVQSSPESAVVPEPAEPAQATPAVTGENDVLASLRPLLKTSKRGGASAEIAELASAQNKNADEILTALAAAGLAAPAEGEEKSATVEQGEDIFWLQKNADNGSLSLHAKPAKSGARRSGGRSRGGKKPKTEKSAGGESAQD